MAKLPYLAPKGPETASFNFEVNPEKVEVDKISSLKTQGQEKEIVGNDEMNQEIFNSASVPFPEPKVPETASFNFKLQGDPENVEVDKISPLKTPTPEKEIIENDKVVIKKLASICSNWCQCLVNGPKDKKLFCLSRLRSLEQEL